LNYCSSVLSILKNQHTCDRSKSLWHDPLTHKNIRNSSLLLVDHEIIDVPYLKICCHTPCYEKTGLTEYRMFCGEILILVHFQNFFFSCPIKLISRYEYKVIKGHIMRFKFRVTNFFYNQGNNFMFLCHYHHLMFSHC
jgi:hypothetical protein